MDSRVTELLKIGDGLFSGRGNLMSYWRELAENFYPERADFTAQRSDGDWWTGLMSSEPVLKRRELANMIQSMLRPEGGEWFETHVADDRIDQAIENRRWLEYMEDVQRRAMYFSSAAFVKAMKLADHDWVTFGMAVIKVDVRRDRPSLFYRCDHIRDHAWSENVYGEIDTDYMKWRPSARQLVQLFGANVHREVKTALDRNDPERRIECCHIVRPREGYEDRPVRSPRARFVSIFIDKENEHVMEETPLLWFPYVIPRWQTIHGSQYGWSPATGPGLTDALTMQQVGRSLLEAGEKAIDPPLLAYEEALRSDINIYARGITYIDRDVDERQGEALRELYKSKSGLPYGLEILDRLNRVLYEGHFLDKMQLPADQGKMTAYEVRKRLEEHIRAALPLLAPAEDEYSAKICEKTFEVLRFVRAFGPEEDIPPDLQHREIRYEFQSPIREMADELKAQKLLEGLEIVSAAGKFDESQLRRINLDKAVVDALQGKKLPAEWIVSDKEFAAIKANDERRRQVEAGADALERGAGIAAQIGQAQQLLTQQRRHG